MQQRTRGQIILYKQILALSVEYRAVRKFGYQRFWDRLSAKERTCYKSNLDKEGELVIKGSAVCTLLLYC